MIAPAMIVAALVLIAVAVGVVVLAGGGGGGLDGEGAAEGFAALADDAEFDDGGNAELRRCPFGEQEDLNERVAGTLDLADDVIDGEAYQYMSERFDDFPESLWCVSSADLTTDATDNIIYTASELPRDDYDRFLEDSFPEANVEVGDEQDHKGGTIYPYCFEPDDESLALPGCGADWVHEDADIAIGLNYTTDEGDADAAVDALEELLPDLVEALADES
jgi:hypothetical protein